MQERRTEVRYDLETSMAAGLFRPVYDVSAENRPKATIRRTHSDGYIDFNCFEQLCDHDEDVLLAVLHMIQDKDRGVKLNAEPKSSLGKKMRDALQTEGSMADKPASYITTTYNEIATIMKIYRPSSKDYARIKNSIRRLSNVKVDERIDSKDRNEFGQSGFFTAAVEGDKVVLAVCNRLTNAAFSEAGWRYAVNRLDERFQLSSGLAKEAHRFLSAWVWSGKRAIHVDRICENIYGLNAWNALSDSGRRTARQKTRTAIGEISNLASWDLEIEGRGEKSKVILERHKNKGTEVRFED